MIESAALRRWRVSKLEDGEAVVQIRGWRRSARWPSQNPHAGTWSSMLWYLYLPRRAKNRARVAAQYGLEDRSGDSEVLLTGAPDSMLTLLVDGPSWARARVRRTGRPGVHPEHLKPFAFKALEVREREVPR